MATPVRRTTRSIHRAKEQLQADLRENCAQIARRRGVNLFEVLLDYVQGNAEALKYSPTRTRIAKDGSTFEESTITPEMRLAATMAALKYVAPQLSAAAITELESQGEDEQKKPATRQDIINAIKNDPFFQAQKHEVIDVTPNEGTQEAQAPDPDTLEILPKDPFK